MSDNRATTIFVLGLLSLVSCQILGPVAFVMGNSYLRDCAAMDVFAEEPYTGPLRGLDNVVLTAHMGSYAREARQLMESEALQNLLTALREMNA